MGTPAIVAEVLSDLYEMQAKRREEHEAKGEDLRRKCEKSEWSHCKAVVSTRGPVVRRGRRCASAGCYPAQAPTFSKVSSPRNVATSITPRSAVTTLPVIP